MQVFEKGPLHCTSADFTSMLMTSEKRITEMVHPVRIRFLSSWHTAAMDPEENLRLKPL